MSDENIVGFGNYFDGSGYTTAGLATGSPSSQKSANNPESNPSGTKSDMSNTAKVAASGNPFAFWLALLGILIVLTFCIEKFDTGSTFGNVKLSAYNSMVIGLNAVLFLSVTKYIFAKYPIPGLSGVFLTA